MKRNIITACILVLLFSSLPLFAQKTNKLTKNEKKECWELLFNGNNFDGWRQFNGDAKPATWRIEDDAMKVFQGEGRSPHRGAGGDIIYGGSMIENFELSIDWKAGEMANSGIFYHIREIPDKPIYYAASEVQIFDNDNATDIKLTATWPVLCTICSLLTPQRLIRPANEIRWLSKFMAKM